MYIYIHVYIHVCVYLNYVYIYVCISKLNAIEFAEKKAQSEVAGKDVQLKKKDKEMINDM